MEYASAQRDGSKHSVIDCLFPLPASMIFMGILGSHEQMTAEMYLKESNLYYLLLKASKIIVTWAETL